MLVVVTYDVSTVSSAGRKRLRRVAKVCQNFGQRVQNSVFECIVDATQYSILKVELNSIINVDQDSLRFYQLGNTYKNKIEHMGKKDSIDLAGPLLY